MHCSSVLCIGELTLSNTSPNSASSSRATAVSSTMSCNTHTNKSGIVSEIPLVMPTQPQHNPSLTLALVYTTRAIHCQPYTVSHTLSAIHCQPYTVSHTLSAIHCQPYTVSHTLSAIHCQPYTVSHTLSAIHCQPYTVSHTFPSLTLALVYTTCTLSAIHCQPYTVSHTLSAIHFLVLP